MRVTDLLLPEVLEFEVSSEYHKSISFFVWGEIPNGIGNRRRNRDKLVAVSQEKKKIEKKLGNSIVQSRKPKPKVHFGANLLLCHE